MKLMNTMFKLTALACALTASLSAFAGGGGDGGQIQSDLPMPSDVISQNLMKSKVPAYYTLQALEFAYQGIKPTETAVAYSLIQKVFNGPANVYQALQDATFIPTNDEHACDGLPEKDPDACAFPDTKKIYFIIPRIAAKNLTYQSGPAQIVALVVHESVHLIKGTTEDEARLAQTQMQGLLSSGVYQAIPQVPDHIKDALAGGNSLAQAAQIGSQTKDFCSNLMIAYMEISDAATTDAQEYQTTGILVIPTKQSWNVNAAALKLTNLLEMCGSIGKNPAHDALFKTRTAVPLIEYAKATSTPDAYWDPLPNLQIRRVSKGATAAINSEMKEIVDLLKQAQEGTK